MNSTKELRLINISLLTPSAHNARTHSEEQILQLRASLREFGFVNPVLIDGGMNVLAGHGRIMAAQAEGITEVPCVLVEHLTEAQKRAYIIADNQLALKAGWDMEILKAEILDLQEMNFDIDLVGFDNDELMEIMETGAEEVGATEDEFDGALPDEPVSQPGDVYQLGRHRLMCGDSTDINAVEKLMDGLKADMLLTDPPYNVAYEGKTKAKLKIENDEMSNDAFRAFLSGAFNAADSVMKPGAVFYIWHADTEGYNFRGACLDIGWHIRQCLVWHKNSMVMGRQDYHWQHEPCLYGWKEGAGHLWASDRKQTTILEFDRPTKSKEHPTMKPIKLFDYQMQNNTKGGDMVLDLFGGSGTTIMAAEQNGRVCRMMELDPKYVDVIIKRWETFTGEKAVRL